MRHWEWMVFVLVTAFLLTLSVLFSQLRPASLGTTGEARVVAP